MNISCAPTCFRGLSFDAFQCERVEMRRSKHCNRDTFNAIQIKIENIFQTKCSLESCVYKTTCHEATASHECS